MKSVRLPSGATLYAQERNALRSDSVASAFLLPHQQYGALALGTNPSNGQTLSLVVNGTTITLTGKTGALSNPGDFSIQGSAAATVALIWGALQNPTTTTSTFVALSAANAQLVQYLGWALPAGGTTITPCSLNTSTYAPLTSFSASTTFTSGTWTAQTMQLYVEAGTYFINGTRYLFLGGSTPTVTAPSSHPRIDVLTIDTSGTLAWTVGTENASPSAPAYPSNKIAICELSNVVGETALYDNENQQANQGYISNDVRGFLNYGANFGAFANDIIPDTTDTRSLGNNSIEFLNLYVKNIVAATTVTLGGQNVAFAKFGGTGADGALSISSGTTTINCGGAAIVVKNYSSISITGTAALAFSNPNANGTTIVLKSQGAVTITSSASAAIDVSGLGGSGGNGGTGNNTGGSGSGGGGAGGANLFASGNLGTAATTGTGSGGDGSSGNSGVGIIVVPAGGGGLHGGANAQAGQAVMSNPYSLAIVPFAKFLPLAPGSGGGGGGSGSSGSPAGGNGGAGSGALYIECTGALNFTGTINAKGIAGLNGTNGTTPTGCGGGGGGGTVIILYGSLTANTGTINVNGGGTGSTGPVGGTGATGASLVASNTDFV